MKRRKFLVPLAFAMCILSSTYAKESSAGIVNFSTCVTDSKYGQQEQENFDTIKNQITALMSDKDNELQELERKFQDPEFVDSLSPEAEQELKGRFQTLTEELNRYQNQYYQVMNQANMRLVQTMLSHVSQASEAIAKKSNLDMILNKEACFYYNPKKDITASVIAEMDKSYAKNEASNPSTAAAETSEKAPN